MKSNNLQQYRLERAKHRVKKLKGFYIHLLIFITINVIVILINIQNLAPGESYFQFRNFLTLGLWGMGIIAHALSVYLPNFILGSNWEERKIKEFMGKQEDIWE